MSNGLKGMAAQAPALNEQAAKRAREAQRIQLTQQLAQAPGAQQGGAGALRTAQAAAPAVTQAAAGSRLQASQAAADQLGRIAQVGLQQKAVREQGEVARAQMAQQAGQQTQELQAQAKIDQDKQHQREQFSQQEIALQDQHRKLGYDVEGSISFLSQKQRKDLAKLGENVKGELFDSMIAFERDEAGRKFSNEKQQLAWARVNARSEQEFLDKAQTIQLQLDRKGKFLDLLAKKLRGDLERNFKAKQQQKDHASKAYMKELLRDIKINKRKAANFAGMMQGIGQAAEAGGEYYNSRESSPDTVNREGTDGGGSDVSNIA